MAEIKGLNSRVTFPEVHYGAHVRDNVLGRKRTRVRARQAVAALRRSFACIAAMTVVLVILLQSMAIYGTQRSIAEVNNEVLRLKQSNETLRVSLLQANNLERSREEALAQQFVSRAGLPGLRVDLAYDNFTGSGLEAKVQAAPGMLNRLMAAFE